MPEPSKFWDKIAERYNKDPIKDEESYQHKLQYTRELLRPDMEVLEFGCGTGGTAIIHAPYVKHILAIDYSSNMLAIAKENAAAGGITNVTFEQANIDNFNAPDQGYDMVLGLSILHLLADRDETISKVYAMLKPGGLFVSSTVCVGETMKFIKYIAPVAKLVGLMPLLRVFTVQDLADSMIAAGFEIDYRWHPAKDKAVFIVARKAEA